MSDIKQVIVMRTDLNMRKGKMIAQGAHASIAFLTNRLEVDTSHYPGPVFKGELTSAEYQWIKGSFKKVVVQVGSEIELLAICQVAREKQVHCDLITDSGLTEFGGVPTNTCCSIGPDEADKIDAITGHLKLL